MNYTFTCECGGDESMKCAELEQGYPCLAEAAKRPLLYTHWVRPHHAPVPMNRADLAALLQDIQASVAAGDSFEGNFEYTMPDPEDFESDKIPEDTWAIVRGAYRIGNSMGQGGLRFIGAAAE